MFSGFSPQVSARICWSTLDLCAACQKPNAVKACSNCGIKYCSRDCQKADWKRGHKQMCPVLTRIGVKTWGARVQADIEKEEKKLLIVPQFSVEPAPAEKMKELESIYGQALDLMTGRCGYLQARDRYVASGDDASEEFLAETEEGPRNVPKAKKMLKKASKAGYVPAMYALASLNFCDEEEEEALTWCRRAAYLGHAEAQVTLGFQYYMDGRNGHALDFVKGLLWMRRAVAHGAIGIPDPRGEFLSKASFEKTQNGIINYGRKLYLEKSPIGNMFYGDEEYDEVENDLEMKLSASCGTGAAVMEVNAVFEREDQS